MKRREIQQMIAKSVVSNAAYMRLSGVPEGVVAVSLELPDGTILYDSFSIQGLDKNKTL